MPLLDIESSSVSIIHNQARTSVKGAHEFSEVIRVNGAVDYKYMTSHSEMTKMRFSCISKIL